MADPGIVAEEKTALGEEGDEFAERTPVRRRAEGGEGGGGGGVGFAGDEEEFGAVFAGEPGAELDPAGERPVFWREPLPG